MVEVVGIEPTMSGPKPDALPLGDTSIFISLSIEGLFVHGYQPSETTLCSYSA